MIKVKKKINPLKKFWKTKLKNLKVKWEKKFKQILNKKRKKKFNKFNKNQKIKFKFSRFKKSNNNNNSNSRIQKIHSINAKTVELYFLESQILFIMKKIKNVAPFSQIKSHELKIWMITKLNYNVRNVRLNQAIKNYLEINVVVLNGLHLPIKF